MCAAPYFSPDDKGVPLAKNVASLVLRLDGAARQRGPTGRWLRCAQVVQRATVHVAGDGKVTAQFASVAASLPLVAGH